MVRINDVIFEKLFSIFIKVRLVSDVVHYYSGFGSHTPIDINNLVMGRDEKSNTRRYYAGGDISTKANILSFT